ncbi:hypothetical protein JH06_3226 [Blastocystis sp. subtype 4]|uniref:hypothetical protein n=1 Tax=Blastocystis sp. subtype 4 TaxID=944170 RepID=UPI00071156E5|nr:hypothetical protein JH06_3226 [Blastocystis sp. subtype 4]KNB42955.1 hypothetical protein JH06_3226 [Blastocystis sp. subtype 4]|eukprot:XP_014526398.1 hypothetical protein JH06_3226 [Blastocystis sp. subtype 4]
MPFWKKPSLEDQVIELKMTSRSLNAQYKKAEQEAKNYEKKMKAEVVKGNQEGAKIYAESSIRMRNQAKQFMVLSSRVEAAAMTMQSVSSMSGISKSMSSCVSAIKAASTSMDINRMYAAMDGFKQACEDSNVMMAGFTDAMGSQSVASSESADALLAQAQLEVAAEKGTLEGTVPATAAQLPATAQANPNDLVNRLNNL